MSKIYKRKDMYIGPGNYVKWTNKNMIKTTARSRSKDILDEIWLKKRYAGTGITFLGINEYIINDEKVTIKPHELKHNVRNRKSI